MRVGIVVPNGRTRLPVAGRAQSKLVSPAEYSSSLLYASDIQHSRAVSPHTLGYPAGEAPPFNAPPSVTFGAQRRRDRHSRGLGPAEPEFWVKFWGLVSGFSGSCGEACCVGEVVDCVLVVAVGGAERCGEVGVEFGQAGG